MTVLSVLDEDPTPARSIDTPRIVTPSRAAVASQPLIVAKDLSVFYNDVEAIKSVSLSIPRNQVVAMIGPSGCGKSTFLRSINRLNALIPGCRTRRELDVGPHNIYDPKIDLVALRRHV